MQPLSVLCLNCFGIPVSFNKRTRFRLIAKEIEKTQPDIVMLQEVIEHRDKKLFVAELEKFGWSFYSIKNGLLESGGLVIITKNLKLREFKFHKFKEQGNRLITIPDKFLGKGFLSGYIEIDSKKVLIINAHLICPYDKSQDAQISQRKQFKQLAEFVAYQKVNNIVLAGDLNSDPDSKDITYLKNKCKLLDPLSVNDMTIVSNNTNRGWLKIGFLRSMFGDRKSYRTDYILTSKGISVKDSEVTFNKLKDFNGSKIHLSDHFAVISKIQI